MRANVDQATAERHSQRLQRLKAQRIDTLELMLATTMVWVFVLTLGAAAAIYTAVMR